jgi:hypothetical protein
MRFAIGNRNIIAMQNYHRQNYKVFEHVAEQAGF